MVRLRGSGKSVDQRSPESAVRVRLSRVCKQNKNSPPFYPDSLFKQAKACRFPSLFPLTMTEYDYSPEALDRYVRKQRTIAQWVYKTEQGPMRDPHTPATPAANTYPLENSERPSDDLRIHHRGLSYDQYDRHPNRDLDNYGGRDKERGVNGDKHKHKARSLHNTSRPPHRRHRSSSQSATRQQSVPPPLPLPPHPWHVPYSQKPPPMPQYYPKLTSPRDSRHSSRSSSTTRLHSPNSHFPPQTSPKYPADNKYTKPVREGRVPDFTVSLYSSCSQSNFHCRLQNAPQYPHSAYQVQPPPTLFKRLIRGLTGGNKQNTQRVPRRKRSSSF